MAERAELMRTLGRILAPAGRTLVLTWVATTALGLAVSAGASYVASARSGTAAAAVGLLSVVAWLFAATLLAGKRATARGLVVATEEIGLGAHLLGVLFERMLRVDEDGEMGARGVAAAQRVENLPLREAEARLSAAVEQIATAPEEGGGVTGGLRRRVRDVALERVAAITLTRFRDEAATAGGVDLVRVRDALAEQVDDFIAEGIEDAALRVTLLGVGAAVALSVTAALLTAQT